MTKSEALRAAHIAAVTVFRCDDGKVARYLELRRGKSIGFLSFSVTRDRISKALLAEVKK